MRPAVVALLLALNAHAEPAQVQPPRPYGHFIGDVLQQRIALRSAGGRALDLATPPEPGRVDAWLERRPPRVEGGWLVIDYQVVNSPAQPRRVSLPALRLDTRQGPVLEVPAWAVSIAPLVAVDTAASAPLLPPRPAPGLDEAAPLQRLRTAAILLAAILLGWAALTAWQRWRAAASLPFAHAMRTLRRLPQDAPEAWQVLHRAFDHCAGQALRGGHLAPLYTRAPWLRPLRPQIEAFYADSAALFFAPEATPRSGFPLALARTLRRLERGAVSPPLPALGRAVRRGWRPLAWPGGRR